MRFFLIMVCIFGMILFVDNYNEDDTDALFNVTLKAMNKESKNPKILLSSSDLNLSIDTMNEYSKKGKEFKKRRDNLEITDNKQLIDFYIRSLSIKRNIKFASPITLFFTRVIYEPNVLDALKEDLKKSNLSINEKTALLKSIKKLVMLSNKPLYELIKERNKFYAKNMKKYIAIRNSTDSLTFNKNTYSKFLFDLNKGESLLIQGIKQNNFKLFNEFVNNELKPSAEEEKLIEKGSLNNTSAVNYWIQMQVYARYIKADEIYSKLMCHIKTQQTFFDDL